MMGIPNQDINVIFFSNYKGKKNAGEFTESMKNLLSGGWLRCSSCWAISIAMLTSSWCPMLSSLSRSPGAAEESLSDWMGDRIWSWSCELALIDSSSGGALGQEFNEYSTSQAFINPCGAQLVVAELFFLKLLFCAVLHEFLLSNRKIISVKSRSTWNHTQLLCKTRTGLCIWRLMFWYKIQFDETPPNVL